MSKRFILLSILLISFQTYLLVNKYIETITNRENYDSCASICVKLDTSDNIENNLSRVPLKNDNLSALIFLNSLSNDFLLYNVAGVSELSHREFKKFVEVFTSGKIVNVELPIKSETLEIDVNKEYTKLSSFPWLDLGPPNIIKYEISKVEVLSYEKSKTKAISYVMVVDETLGKLLIVDKRLLLND